jgi:hypothetical protein
MFGGSIRFNLDPLQTKTDDEIWEVHIPYLRGILIITLK